MKTVHTLTIAVPALLLSIAACLWCGRSLMAAEAHDHDHDPVAEGHDHVAESPDLHAGHDHAKGEEEAHDHELRLTEAQMKDHGVALASAGPAELMRTQTFPGELRLDEDRVAHVVPRVAGVAAVVRVSVGDRVRRGDVLAVLESREAAEMRLEAKAAAARAARADETLRREEALWSRQATSEREVRDARLAVAEAAIAHEAADTRLETLGLKADVPAPGRLTLVAPIDGTVLERHLTVGEYVTADAGIFTLADLSEVWADLRVDARDLDGLRAGNRVTLVPGGAKGSVRWVSPMLDSATRTAVARVTLPNPEGTLRPGMFVTGRLELPEGRAAVAVRVGGLQTLEGHSVVFVRHEDGAFAPVKVRVGRRDAVHAEILEGLSAGQTYVAAGAFVLKSELSKAAFGDGHNH